MMAGAGDQARVPVAGSGRMDARQSSLTSIQAIGVPGSMAMPPESWGDDVCAVVYFLDLCGRGASNADLALLGAKRPRLERAWGSVSDTFYYSVDYAISVVHYTSSLFRSIHGIRLEKCP